MKKDARQEDRLISGKLRRKAGRQGAVNELVTVDGLEYVWAYRHGWVVWGKGIKAVSLSVALRPGRTRELILDLTVAVEAQDNTPSDKRVREALPDAVRAAREAGWDPESRGRSFRFELGENL